MRYGTKRMVQMAVALLALAACLGTRPQAVSAVDLAAGGAGVAGGSKFTVGVDASLMIYSGTGPAVTWDWTEGAVERAASVRTEVFTESARELANPDRGLYRTYPFVIPGPGEEYVRWYGGEPYAGGAAYGKDVEKHCMDDPDLTLALVEVSLENYRDAAGISESGLDNIEWLLEAWAGSGRRMLLRFVYDLEGNGPANEPDDIDTILRHMEQVGPYLREYADSIFTLQGIFTGSWGEMHATRFGSAEDMRVLAGKLAEVTDPSTYLAVRTPAQWRAITLDGKDTALAGRMGLFNDGMLGSETDLGTYLAGGEDPGTGKLPREDELAFQDGLCAAVPNGGQVVGEAGGPYNNFRNAVRDMSRMHVSYIDRYWQAPVLEDWDKTVLSGSEWGCFAGKTGLDYIRGHLGYRLLVDRADVSSGPSSDGLGVSVDFRNAGFAPLYGDLDVTLRLVDGTGLVIWSCRMDHELAALSGGDHAGDVGTARAAVSLKGLEDGTYGIFVDLAAGGGRTPVLLANGQDREPGLGYLVGTVALSTYGSFVLPATGGAGIWPAMAAGWMLSALSGLALASVRFRGTAEAGRGRGRHWADVP